MEHTTTLEQAIALLDISLERAENDLMFLLNFDNDAMEANQWYRMGKIRGYLASAREEVAALRLKTAHE